MGTITFTRDDFTARREHLQRQRQITQQEIQRLQGQYQAIDGALQDVDFWESKLDELDAELKATAEKEAEKDATVYTIVEETPDGAESGSRKTRGRRKTF